MELDEEQEVAFEEQQRVITELSDRIDDTLSYLDWLSSITSEIEEPYIEQIVKILEGKVEH